MKSIRNALLTVLLVLGTTARAVIILGDDPDPAVNRIAPNTAFPHDGWDYEGLYGVFLGTPIAPHFFISAKHISGATGSVLNFQGTDYTVTREYRDPVSDLDIFEVDGTFLFFAPLYDREDESGQRIVDVGRGTDRGGEILFNGDPQQRRGWFHGADSHIERWGENIVAGWVHFGPEWDVLAAAFDIAGLPSECHLSGGDSGGAAFINDGGIWKLAGINYAIDSGFYTAPDPGTAFNGAIFDLRGYYYRSGDAFVQFNPEDPSPIPTSFYPTRISTKLLWINSVIDPAGDHDGNGVPNLLQYAGKINSALPGAWSAPSVATGPGYVSITYRKITGTTQLVYQIEQSPDLVSWTIAAPDETPAGAPNENVQTIESKVGTNGSARLFLRLRITQQP